jgi:hypothetical protein
MPSALRSRIALFALLGAFLIPIGMSSLRGLTHVLTCQAQEDAPFTMIIPEDGGDPLIQSSTFIERGDEAGLCGGLSLELGARIVGPTKILLEVPIANNSESDWRGTVKLVLGKTSFPVDIGEIAAGETETDEVTVSLKPGAFELNGSLLIGP